jgi:hypothetical protein
MNDIIKTTREKLLTTKVIVNVREPILNTLSNSRAITNSKIWAYEVEQDDSSNIHLKLDLLINSEDNKFNGDDFKTKEEFLKYFENILSEEMQKYVSVRLEEIKE